MEEKKLNKRERYKARLKPIDYYKDFETIDFENLGEGDRFYLQDFGIFTTDFLEDEFTIRIRVAGGRIRREDFVALGEIVKEYDLTIVLTARAGIQLHDIDVDDLLEIHKRINALNLTTWQSFGDNVRNIVTDAYDGVIEESEIECYPLIEQMQNYILKNPRYVGMLPRRVSIGISGNTLNVGSFFANDIYFALAKKEGKFGFNLYMGGKNTEVAKDVDIFLEKEEVFDFFKAFVETFYKHGSRYSRSKTRLFYFIEEIGVEKLKELIEAEYKKKFRSKGELMLKKGEFSEFKKLKDGSYAFVYQTNFSKLTAEEITQITEFASKYSLEIRFGIDQNIYLLGLKEPICSLTSPSKSSTIVACAGNLCPYAVWSIKDETRYLPLELIEKHSLYVGFSGCAKGCGRHRHTDIGLIGLKTNNFGDTEGGCRVFIGAQHSYGESVGRELFSMVPFVHLNTTIECIIELYELSGYDDFEVYAKEILAYYSELFLALWHLKCLETNRCIALPQQKQRVTEEIERDLLFTNFEDFELVDDDFKKSISHKVKELWTVKGEAALYTPPIKRTAFR